MNPENFSWNAKQELPCPDYSVGSDQDEAEIQYDQWSTQEWCSCEKCEKMSTS